MAIKTTPKLSDIFKGYQPLVFPNAFSQSTPSTSIPPGMTPVTRTLPNGAGTYQSPVIAQPTAPVVQRPTAPVVQRPTAPVTPPQAQPPAPQALDYSKYTDPATGRVLTPQEYADSIAKRAVGGSVPNYAGNQLTQGPQTREQLAGTATDLNNQRNDIATGTADPYKAGNQSGIAYSPAELSAIEKAYAGVYDPTLKDVFAKLDKKDKEDAAALASKNKLTEMAQQHKYDLELKKTPTPGQSSSIGGVYVAGANPQVDAMAEQIWNGKATMANVPKEYKMQVASAMQTYGNQVNGRPTTTEIGKQKLTVAKKLLEMFDAGEGTSTVGRSRLFGGGIAVPGSKSADFYSFGDQLMAIAQLDASKFLKGQGQVSDAERAILANAATNLKYNQSEELFRKTLVEMIGALEGNIPPEKATTGTEQPQTMILNGQTLTLQADGTYE